MSRATSEQNKAGFRWMVFFMMIIAAVCVGARGGAIKAPFTQPIELLRNGSVHTATVKSCVSTVIRIGGGTSTRSTNKTVYTTQAFTSNGASARGGYFGWKGTKWCESKIGDEVKVRIHKTDPSLNRISTFTGLWYPPFQILLALFWLIIASRVKPLAWAVLGLNLIVIPLMFNMA